MTLCYWCGYRFHFGLRKYWCEQLQRNNLSVMESKVIDAKAAALLAKIAWDGGGKR